MVSIIIPAYNEENVIARCLAPLLPAAKNKELEIIVVCNGCTDKTAQIVAQFAELVKLIETPIPSKTNALNLGDQAASDFPRFYLDADVVISLESIRKVAEVLNSGGALAAAPQAERKREHSSWIVRSYYDVWEQLPYVQEGMIGTGVYALSKEGRKRFGKFPNIIADDGYVRALFKSNERCTVQDIFSYITVPANTKELLKIKSRSRAGFYQIQEKFPELKKNEEKKYWKIIFLLQKGIYFWIKLPVYICIVMLSSVKAKNILKKNNYNNWLRDNSSRMIS